MNATDSTTASRVPPAASDLPLCVELDRTLVRTNLFYECALACVRSNPWLAFAIPFWFLRGRAYLWSRLARTAVLDPATLPYRAEVLSYIRAEKGRGREIVLVSRAHRRIAEAVARHVGMSSAVIATDDRRYCSGDAKAMALVFKYGAGGFDYMASSHRDVVSWYASSLAVLVNAGRRSAAKLEKKQISRTTLDVATGSKWRALLFALRPHQVVKNLLVFAPMFLSHRWGEATVMRNALLVFEAFCCASFAGYLLNDLLDLEADRHHPVKRARPLAAGHLSVPDALVAAVVLLALALLAGFSVAAVTGGLVAGYFGISVAYSCWLKRVDAVDVVVLAGLYCCRVIAGGAATHIVISPWTLAFSLFMFLSLALMKRYAELYAPGSAAVPARRRAYGEQDRAVLMSVGSASAILSVLVIALYVNSADVRIQYSRQTCCG